MARIQVIGLAVLLAASIGLRVVYAATSIGMLQAMALEAALVLVVLAVFVPLIARVRRMSVRDLLRDSVTSPTTALRRWKESTTGRRRAP